MTREREIELITEIAACLRSDLCKEAKGLIFMALYAQVMQEPPPLQLLSFFKETSENETPTNKNQNKK